MPVNSPLTQCCKEVLQLYFARLACPILTAQKLRCNIPYEVYFIALYCSA